MVNWRITFNRLSMTNHINELVAPGPHSLGQWVAWFSEAKDSAKPALAEQWVKRYLGSMRNNGVRPDYNNLRRVMDPIRAMLWSAPSGGSVRQEMETWIKNYTLRQEHEYAISISVLHDLWLAPELNDRKSALLKLHADQDLYRKMGFIGERWLRDAIWSVVHDDLQDKRIVAAAARVTMNLFGVLYGQDTSPTKYPIIDALGVLRMRCIRLPNPCPSVPSNTDLKAMVVARPLVAIAFLIHLEQHKIDVSDRQRSSENFEGAATWIPSHTGVLEAAEAIGMPYLEALDEIATSLVDDVDEYLTLDLTENISP